MTSSGRWQSLKTLLLAEWRQLSAINRSDRLWHLPFAAALASGLPLFVGAGFDRMDYGLVSSLGGMVFLYTPPTPLHHRMVSLMACAFAMTACYALGLLSQFVPVLMMPALVFIAIVVTMLCRFYALGPPGSLFFVLAAAIGAYSPTPLLQVPLMVGLIFMGALLACLIAFFYSLYALRLQPAAPVAPVPPPSFEFVVFDSVVIGVFVGISLALAQLLALDRPYWVPISCLAVMQGASLRAVWNRQLQRVAGTSVGLLVAWGLLLMPLDRWSISLTMMALAFIIELTVVRHYGFATVFITPLTILLAEAATLGSGSTAALIEARFFDTVLGWSDWPAASACTTCTFSVAGRQMRRLMPTRRMR